MPKNLNIPLDYEEQGLLVSQFTHYKNNFQKNDINDSQKFPAMIFLNIQQQTTIRASKQAQLQKILNFTYHFHKQLEQLINQQLTNSQMRKYQIHLSISNMKQYKHGSSYANYYLCVQNELQQREYSVCQNIILTESLFTFEVNKQIKLLEIWNYDKRKKIGTVVLKRQKETCFFTYEFRNFNLKLSIKSFNLLLPLDELKPYKKESIRTEESQNELNCSLN